VRNARAYCAGVVLGATLVAAAWLYTYRAWEISSYTDRYAPFPVVETRVRVHPWWAVLGALCLPLIGAGVSLWLLPEGRRLIERFVARLAAVFSTRPS
jgi:hypothetical protein